VVFNNNKNLRLSSLIRMLLIKNDVEVFMYLVVNGRALCNSSVGTEGMHKTKFS